jgi:hypothetical protein
LTKAADFERVSHGSAGEIRLSPSAKKEYDKLESSKDPNAIRQRTQLKKFFERFCSHGEAGLSPEQFKREGTYPGHNRRKIGIWCFKPWQWRLYGAILEVMGKKTFVGVRVDPAKKQNKADQALLKAAANAIAELEEHKKESERS